MNPKEIRVLFFIGSLRAGGKERRLLELLNYLKKNTDIKLMVVMTTPIIDFPYFYDLEVEYKFIKKSLKKGDFTVFYKFYKICKEYRPDIIHTWGAVQTFYTLPTISMLNIPLVNSQITSAPPKEAVGLWEKLIDKVNFKHSKIIISNSEAGIRSFNPPRYKSVVIYNGINLGRFENLPEKHTIKDRYNIHTPYTIVMIASLSANKDYDLFYRLAEKISARRKDITFIGAGAFFENDPLYQKTKDLGQVFPNIKFLGRIEEVEALVNACELGVLFSTNGEGISNSIMEYMALSKPVIANDAGGTSELVKDGYNGYLIKNETDEELTIKMLELLDNVPKNKAFGANGRKIITNNFSLDKMGKAFLQVYLQVIQEQGIKQKLSKKETA